MSGNIDIRNEFTNEGGRYFASVAGGWAELTYRRVRDGVIAIDHTYVPTEARGGKIAERLVERAVADARAEGVRIVPECPYVAVLFKRRPDLDERSAS